MSTKGNGGRYSECGCMQDRWTFHEVSDGMQPKIAGKAAVMMSACRCADDPKRWRVRLDLIHAMDWEQGHSVIFNNSEVYVGVVDAGPFGRFLPWEEHRRLRPVFRCGEDGETPEEDWKAALALVGAVQRENEIDELERATAGICRSAMVLRI